MSDLISRSKLLKEIETWGGCVEALHEYISNMPSAYDVDAVVEELKEISKTYCEEYKQREGSLYLQDAVEIVRKGGVNV